MKERPILFSASMVLAILAGQKTQTRRAIKPQPSVGGYYQGDICFDGFRIPRDGSPAPAKFSAEAVGGGAYLDEEIYCPFGQPGDRLWVRETWGVISHSWNELGEMVDWIPDRPAKAIHEMPFGKCYYSGHAIYAADGPNEWAGDDDGGGEPRSAWKPSIYMPRAASRILLEIVSVRVERLNDCSVKDAIAEGAAPILPDPVISQACPEDYLAGYRQLWEQINGEGSWAANPWVWVVEFRRGEA